MAFLPVVLPRLRGVWLWAFRAMWCIALATALFSAIGATWVDAQHNAAIGPGWRTIGAREAGFGVRLFAPDARPWRVTGVWGPEAEALGVRAGDELIGINELSVNRMTSLAAIGLALGDHEGQSTRFLLRPADGVVRETTLVFHQSNVDLWYRGSGLSPLLIFLLRRIGYDVMTLVLLAASTILFLRRSDEAVAAAFSLGLCMIPIGPTIEFWAQINALGFYHVLAALPYIALLMVGCAFPDGRYWPPWTRFSLILVPAILLPAIFSATEYSQFTLFTAPAFIAVIVVLALRYRRLPQGVERQQFRWAAFGFSAGVTLLILRWPFAQLQGDLHPAPLSPWIDLAGSFLHALGYAVIGAGFGVALIKYRLYDAELLISRSTAITAMTLMLAGLWAASEKALETFLPNLVGQQFASLASIFGAGFAVVLVAAAHRPMQHFIEKRFHKGVYRLREELPKLLDTLVLRFDTKDLCTKVLNDIANDVRVTKAAILLRGKDNVGVAAEHGVDAGDLQSWIDARGEAPADGAAPSVFNVALPLNDPVMNENIGWLLVGPRPDGTTCNRDERAALAAVAPPIARAIATVQARDSRERR